MLAALGAVSFLPAQKASADAAVATCSNTFLESWDWPADLKRPPYPGDSKGNTGAAITNFDPGNASYIIYQLKSNYNSTPKRNIFQMVLKTGNGQLWLKDNGSGIPTITYPANSVGALSATIQSEPRNMVPNGYYVWPSGYSDVDTNGTNNLSSDIPLDPANVQCVYAAVNVQYDASWSWFKFSGAALYKQGADGASTCTAMDIGCKISQAFSTVGNSFREVGQAIVDGISRFFMPDGTDIKAQFDDLNSFAQAKLGFLTYPFTFVTNLFNAFNDNSNTWCTTSSCTKSFGNLFGQPFTLNLNLAANAMPTLWTWFCGLIRGITILALLLAIRQKYRGVVHK